MNGRDSAWMTCAASSSASSGSRASSIRTANSSPPSRAAVSLRRRVRESRVPTAPSSWSPVECPRVSLTCLKSSRSMKSRQVSADSRRPRSRARSIRSSSSVRFGSPVSGSWKARWVSSCWSRRCSVTSRRVTTRPPTVGSARKLVQRTSTSTWPSRRRTHQWSCPARDSSSRTDASARAARERSRGSTSSGRALPARSAVPNTAEADGLAYRTVSSSSTIRMTSEVLRTRVRKYASLSRRITSWRSITRSTASPACEARISREPRVSASGRAGPATSSAPATPPGGRSGGVMGHTSTDGSEPNSAARAGPSEAGSVRWALRRAGSVASSAESTRVRWRTAGPSRVSAASAQERATSVSRNAETSEAAAPRSASSRETAWRWATTMTARRRMTSRNSAAEKVAMAAASWVVPRAAACSRTAGAISVARASRKIRRAGGSRDSRVGTDAVSSTMDGCSAASPQAV